MGVEVHSIDCNELASGIDADWIDLSWDARTDGAIGRIRAELYNRPGTLAEIARLHRESGYLADPHSAIGLAAGRHFAEPGVPMVAMATAHPAKFPDAVQKAIGVRPALPARLADLLDRTERVDGLPNDAGALKDMIDDRMAAAKPRVKVRT